MARGGLQEDEAPEGVGGVRAGLLEPRAGQGQLQDHELHAGPKSTFEAFPDEFKQPPNSLFYYEITKTAVRRPSTPAWREYEDLLRTAIRNVIDGGDAKKELDTAVARIDAVLARYKK